MEIYLPVAELPVNVMLILGMGLTMGFIDHLVKLPYSFFLRRSSGDLMMRLQSNTAVRDILATSTMSAVLDGAFATLYLALLFVISPVLAVVVLVLAVLEVSVMVLSWRRNQKLMSGSLQAQADTQSYAYELLAGIETLKASGAEHRAVDRWGGLFIDQVNIDLSRGRLTAAVEAVMSTLQVASPEPGRMRSAMFLGGAGEIRPSGRRGATRPGQGMARLDLRCEQLVLQVAVRDPRAVDQRQHALGFRDRAPQRLLAGDALEIPASSLHGVDDFFDVLEPPMVGPGQPERVDGGIRNHVANRSEWFRVADVETTRALGCGGRMGVRRAPDTEHVGVANRSERLQVESRVETAADEADTETPAFCAHALVPSSPTFRRTSGGGPSKRASATLPT